MGTNGNKILLIENITNISKDQLQKKNNKYLVETLLQRAVHNVDSYLNSNDDTYINLNGRIYPYDVLDREVKKYIEQYISNSCAYGELDHPDTSVVNLKNVSHTIEKIYWRDNDLWGIIEILDTPSGNIVKTLLDSGKTLGISSRALGSLTTQYDKNGNPVEVVGNDLELICWDIVSTPSTKNASFNESSKVAVNESKQFQNNNTMIYDNLITQQRIILLNNINNIISKILKGE